MRLRLPTNSCIAEKQEAFCESARHIVDAGFSFRSMTDNGGLIGAWNAAPHFSRPVLQTCLLVTGSHRETRHQVFGHEQLAAVQWTMSLMAGERTAFDVAYTLNQKGAVVEATPATGGEGMAKIIRLGASSTLTAVSVPCRDEGFC